LARAIDRTNGFAGTVNRPSIVNVLKKFIDDGRVEVVEAPRGQRAGVYRVRRYP
jgi:hypothetical protein